MRLPEGLIALLVTSSAVVASSSPHNIGNRNWYDAIFTKKRFPSEGLVSAGSLGLQDAGRVIALGDWNGDQFVDVITLGDDQRSITIYTWNHDDFTFDKGPSVLLSTNVQNVVPGDYNYDGHLDLLVMSDENDGGWGWSDTGNLAIHVYLGLGSGAIESDPTALATSSLAQPLVLDVTGDLRADLLGYVAPSKGSSNTASTLSMWKNVDGKFENSLPPLDPSKACKLSNPHSSAFVDLNGDCLADLFLHCKDPYSGEATYQIWINEKEDGFVLAREGKLPKGSGSITFGDIDRDGTMDMIFPVCQSVSTSSGVGKDCSINVAYNVQKPLCSSAAAVSSSCRDPQALCVADSEFAFDTSDGSSTMTRTQLSRILPSNLSPNLLLFDITHSPALPLPIRIGDYNLDGYADVLIVHPQSSSSASVKLLRNRPCDDSLPECLGGKTAARRRTFELLSGKGTEILDELNDVRGASFVDIDEDGSVDLMIQRTGAQGSGKVTFIQNNIFHDAFFLKTLVLNGACGGKTCESSNGSGIRYQPFGVSYAGASYKFTILDTAGRRSAMQIGQLAQTGYAALHTPFCLFGLGRTNNYVENLFVGATTHGNVHFTNIEGIIPNSQVFISPPPPSSDIKYSGSWHKELYLVPGDWIPWVTLAVVGTVIGLAGVVVGLHVNEKREDELERKKRMHLVNFNAL